MTQVGATRIAEKIHENHILSIIKFDDQRGIMKIGSEWKTEIRPFLEKKRDLPSLEPLFMA